MTRTDFCNYLRNNDFARLFITEMGWNHFRGYAELTPLTVNDVTYRMKSVAERNGFQIITCPVQQIPSSAVCRKMDYQLRRQANDYICIFYIPKTEHHQWMAPVKNVDKRDIVTIEYERVAQTDFLYSKLDGLTFELDEQTTIVDVKARVQGAFAVNSEEITKSFYAGFRKEHKAFAEFITGIDDQIQDLSQNRNKQWYTSVMLNRLMFCYFIQKKGFFDGDPDYLQHKLEWVRRERGENRFFHSFYRGFLAHLFHDGLNRPRHDAEFEALCGRIPYLNGGMFDQHQLEHDYADIDISDEAFIRLFRFFDTWRWHLDTRITASGKDINPDVLGYIFEQYINDRAQMGAYYTKEDITEYISKNCILPFLMDQVKETTPKAFTPDGYVWSLLRESGEEYLYDAVKRGYSPDWQQQIPAEIARGINTSQPQLLERRSAWNGKTDQRFALPTEIWRETVERLQRCDTLLAKIRAGEITQINDFITLNLDIRSFVYDLIRHTDDHLFVLHFYKALQQVTILDPTCGSGAFLFAAMNILEPLYEVCIERMQELQQHNAAWFKPELDEIAHKYRSNIQYFIYKSIILRNLYGVDIMVEATEIAKLRLFLKMMAVVEVDFRADNLGLDPLPDIDFNIRCGNTLVGYATQAELCRDLAEGDMFAVKEFRDRVEEQMQLVSDASDYFKQVQMTQAEDMQTFKQAKQVLKDRLDTLNSILNQHLWKSTSTGSFDSWKSSHQPFHWLAEFYQIIQGHGGFDVIIGNPPYVEYSSVRRIYNVNNYDCINSGNLYSFVIERSYKILSHNCYLGMIIPISGFCTERMISFINVIKKSSSDIAISNYAERPAKLFEGAERNLSIMISKKKSSYEECIINSSYYYKWKSENRPILFKNIFYQRVSDICMPTSIPKISNRTEVSILCKLRQVSKNVGYFTVKRSAYKFYYKNSGGRYWKFMANFQPVFFLNGVKCPSSRETHLFFSDNDTLNLMTAVFNSTLYYWYYIMYSDARTNNPCNLKEFPIGYLNINENIKEKLITLSYSLMLELQNNAVMVDAKYRTGDVCFAQYLPAKSKPIIDEIDKLLAKHYGFTEEELDFIINYDIKYRMGDELKEGSDE